MKKELNTRRNLLVKAVTVFVLFAMAVTAVMPVPAVKAVTKQTMYVGEKFEYVIYGATVTGVSSSSKKVVKTAKAKTMPAPWRQKRPAAQPLQLNIRTIPEKPILKS